MRKWLFFSIIFAYSSTALAIAPESWKELTFSYQDSNRSVQNLIKVFSESMGLKSQVQYPELLKKELSNAQQINGAPVQVLDRLASIYGFQWYVYRNTLYISNFKSNVDIYVQLKGLSPTQAKQALISAGLYETKFGWSEFERGTRSAVMISGPPSYVQMVKSFLGRINVDDTLSEAQQVMLFPLKYASAIDIEIPTRGERILRLGVANTLKKLLSPARVGEAEHSEEVTKGFGMRMSRSLGSLPSLGGMPSALGGMPSAAIQNIIPSMSSPLGPLGISGTPNSFHNDRRDEEPVIEAYAALNAVIVKDKPSRKSIYEDIVKILDVPSRRVEIVVTIVDVEVSTLDEWIPKISIGGTRNSVNIQPNAKMDSSNEGNIVLISTKNFAVALRNSVFKGNARIQSRPSVMTLDNLSAILDLSETAYFKLLGERNVDVKSVTVGTRLKVTPRVLGFNNDADMHVQVELEDGALQALNSAGELTQSRSNFIATQSVIAQGQSLLIGGYRRDLDENSQSHIPHFSQIPIIGKLFKSELTRNQRVERLFVLSARVIGENIDPINNVF
jgi:type III secretion protein C